MDILFESKVPGLQFWWAVHWKQPSNFWVLAFHVNVHENDRVNDLENVHENGHEKGGAESDHENVRLKGHENDHDVFHW